MDFHGLSRRNLQFFCKRNKIPANMTNIAMADALKALETVEGIDEFVNQFESTCDQSPTSVAKNLRSAARTAARTTRRKTKDETESSELVTRSCHVTSKSLSGELEQENRNTNVLQNPSVPQSRRRAAATSIAINLDAIDMKPETNVSKTPAARSTRRAQVVASSKKDVSVQRVYSTRRSVKLLEESMADLSLKTKKSPSVSAKKNEREDSPACSKSQAKSEDNSGKTEEAEVISVRDLNASLEKEWDGSKNDPDLDVLYGDLGDITFFYANTNEEQMNGIESNNIPASDSFIIAEEQEISQEDDFVVVDHVVCNKESEPEQMKNDSECETEYETDPWEDDDSKTNPEAFGSEVYASDNETVLMADELKELGSDDNDLKESEPEEEETCESEELIDNDSEVVLTSSSSSLRSEREIQSDGDEWSDIEEEKSRGSEELSHPVSDKKAPSPFEAKAVSDPKKSALNLALVAGNEERKAEAECNNKKKKTIDEESLKDVSMRQLTKMVKELAIKSKQQHKCLE